MKLGYGCILDVNSVYVMQFGSLQFHDPLKKHILRDFFLVNVSKKNHRFQKKITRITQEPLDEISQKFQIFIFGHFSTLLQNFGPKH